MAQFRTFKHRFGAVVILALVLHVFEESAQARKMPRDGGGGVFLLTGGKRQEFVQLFGGELLEVQTDFIEPGYKMPQVFLVALDGGGRKVPFHSQEG